MDAKDNSSTDPLSCIVCGYSAEVLGPTEYKGDVKVKEVFVFDAHWQLGSKYVLKDRELRPTCTQPQTHAFLQARTTIPIPKIMMFWEDMGGRFMTIEERIQGETLEDIWSSLSDTDRHDIAQQTADYIKQLRSLQSNRIEGPHGAPLHSAYLFGTLREPSGPFDTKDSFWAALVDHLKKRGVTTKDIDALGQSMPPLEPYTFTSSGLDASCIVVKDRKVVGITDWSTSGYLPCWYEYAMARLGTTAVDQEWKQILLSKLEKYEDGAKWLESYFRCRYPPRQLNPGEE